MSDPSARARPRRWLLLRGLVREQRHWHHFPRTLAARIPEGTVHCLDLPGTGTEHLRAAPSTIAANTDDLRARFLALPPGEGPWGLCAISLGGMVALDWAARFPDDFARAVVINTSAGDMSRPWERMEWRRYGAVLSALLSPDLRERERVIVDLTVQRQDVDREALTREHAAFMQERPISNRTLLAQLYAATRSRLPRPAIPLLVVCSRADRLVRPVCSERIAQRLQAPIRYHPTAGHDLPFDDPTWLADQVAEWSGW